MEDTDRLQDWLASVSGVEWVWFAKRLSANDTGATGGHQVGLYLPKDIAFKIASLGTFNIENGCILAVLTQQLMFRLKRFETKGR